MHNADDGLFVVDHEQDRNIVAEDFQRLGHQRVGGDGDAASAS